MEKNEINCLLKAKTKKAKIFLDLGNNPVLYSLHFDLLRVFVLATILLRKKILCC